MKQLIKEDCTVARLFMGIKESFKLRRKRGCIVRLVSRNFAIQILTDNKRKITSMDGEVACG